MSRTPSTSPVGDLLWIILRHPFRLLIPAVLIAVLVGVYAARRTKTYEASQAVVVRNEAATSSNGPGKFLHQDEMKTIEETILEVAASRSVLEGVLKTVGPPSSSADATSWPTEKAIQEFRDAFKVKPPKGSELGKTEVLYLKVTDPDSRRAVALVEAAYHELRRAFGEVRDARAESMIGELTHAVQLADCELTMVTDRLAEIEQSVGSDLAELRMLDHSTGGGGELSRSLTTINTELRNLRELESEKRDFLELLQLAQQNPEALVAAPSNWFETQSMLLQLREGLIDAQLRTATLLGRLTEKHPKVRAAKREEQAIRDDIFGQLDVAVRGVKAEIDGYAGRQEILRVQQMAAQETLHKLGALRAEYSNLSKQVEHRRTLLEEAQRDLAEAQASQVAARNSSLLSRIGLPEIGSDPVGPSQASIILVGVVGGLLTGLGLVLLTAPQMPIPAAATGHRTPLACSTRSETQHRSSGSGHASGRNTGAPANQKDARDDQGERRRYAQTA